MSCKQKDHTGRQSANGSSSYDHSCSYVLTSKESTLQSVWTTSPFHWFWSSLMRLVISNDHLYDYWNTKSMSLPSLEWNTKQLTNYRDLSLTDLKNAQLTIIWLSWQSSETYLCQPATGRMNTLSVPYVRKKLTSYQQPRSFFLSKWRTTKTSTVSTRNH